MTGGRVTTAVTPRWRWGNVLRKGLLFGGGFY